MIAKWKFEAAALEKEGLRRFEKSHKIAAQIALRGVATTWMSSHLVSVSCPQLLSPLRGLHVA